LEILFSLSRGDLGIATREIESGAARRKCRPESGKAAPNSAQGNPTREARSMIGARDFHTRCASEFFS
jgi:hypothetical protein